MKILCSNCGSEFDFHTMNYHCSLCGGVFDIIDFPVVNFNEKVKSLPGILKYSNYFVLNGNKKGISLGEGETGLIADRYEDRLVYHKMESLNPTGSYKDRGTVVLVNYLLENNIDFVVEDSSGNAGASLAAYTARAGIKTKIYVPESTSGPKRNQIEAYGAQLVPIPGDRSKAAEAVREQADKGIVYASHAYLPLGLLGIATITFELFEELGDTIRNVIMPVGHGGLMLGVIRGFESLLDAGYISRLPMFIGVQAALCAPVANLLDGKSSSMALSHTTIAEGVRVTDPIRGKAIVNYLKRQESIILRIEEDQILASYVDLAKRGIHVEPTSAMVWAALKQLPDKMDGTTVLIQTGSGLKFIPD